MRNAFTLLGLTVGFAALSAGFTLSACDWDTYDPRLAATATGSGGAGGAGGGVGGVGAAGGMGGSGAVGPDDCNGIELMPSDDFSDPLQDRLWSTTNSSGGATDESTGELVMTVGTLSYSVSGYIARYAFDFRGGDASVEVISLPPDPEPVILFQIERTGSNRLYFHANNGTLSARKEVGGIDAVLASVTYNATNHRFWRIRNVGDEMIWETSGSGDLSAPNDWTTIASQSLGGLFDLRFMRPRVYMDSNAAVMGATAIFDNFNFAGAGRNKYCRIVDFADGFEADDRVDTWLLSGGDGGSTYRQFGGELVLTHVPNTGSGYYDYVSANLFDARDSAVSIELKKHLNPGQSYLRLLGDGTRMELRVIDDMLELQYDAGNGGELVGMPVAYEPDTHRFLRLRNDGGTAYWETSPGGQTWSERGSLSPSPVDFTQAVQVRFGSSTPNGGNPDNPPVAVFDNFNIIGE